MSNIDKEYQFPISGYLTVKANQKGIPLHGTFELTGRCNFNCKMCYVHGKGDMTVQKKRELGTEEWLKIAREAKRCGTLTLLLTGGEIMLREDFVELYRKISEMGIRLTINTNGSLIREEVLECFRIYPPGRVNISLYGSSEDTYERLCGNRARAKVTASIRALKKLGISVRTTMTLTPQNCRDMEAVCAFGRQENTLVEVGTYMFPQIRIREKEYGQNEGRLTPEEAGRYRVQWERLRLKDEEFCRRAEKNLGRFLDLEERKTEEKQLGHSIRCQAGRSAYWITWDGKMRPCGMMTKPEADTRKEGFELAWRKIREMVAEIHLPYECKSCQDGNICRVCAAMCLSETGRFDKKPEYVCRMAKAVREEYVAELRKMER